MRNARPDPKSVNLSRNYEDDVVPPQKTRDPFKEEEKLRENRLIAAKKEDRLRKLELQSLLRGPKWETFTEAININLKKIKESTIFIGCRFLIIYDNMWGQYFWSMN